jgi:hypothetical protein
MKRFCRLACWLMCLLTLTVRAQFQWTTNADSSVTITGYTGTLPANLVIPDMVNGRTVTGIAGSSFTHTPLATLSLPDSIVSIGDWAFGYDTLTKVDLPRHLVSIGDWAFGHNSLTNLSLPENVVSVGDWAFAYNALTNANLPQHLASIGDGAFAQNSLVRVNLPGSVASIGNNAFADNGSLTAIYCVSNAPFVRDSTFVTGATNVTVYYLPRMNGWWLTLGGSPTLLMPAPITLMREPGAAVSLPFTTLAKNWNPALITLKSVRAITAKGVKLSITNATILYPADSPNVPDQITYTIVNHDYPNASRKTGVIHIQMKSTQSQ